MNTIQIHIEDPSGCDPYDPYVSLSPLDTIVLDATSVEEHIRPWIHALFTPSGTPEQEQIMRSIKSTLKGMFLVLGPKLLKKIYGDAPLPKPTKNADYVEWYIEEITRAALSLIARTPMTILGTQEDNGAILKISGIRTITTPNEK